ncbi:uncharacterized protein AKAME5_002856900 [Lates japonicus]|uniref:Uncharacterized protein n=1 Tax=Lates japonicus TaxID=270547 RepID=A0AAD3MJZ2_LATJO|nr:uncharacterized protein AKAME5_002856900 [Lates japonicus]
MRVKGITQTKECCERVNFDSVRELVEGYLRNSREGLNRLTQPASSIRETAEDDLDARMRAILNEQGVSSHEKIKKYNTLLQRYLNFMKQGQRDERRVTLTLQPEQAGDRTDPQDAQTSSHGVQVSDGADFDRTVEDVLKSLPPRDTS